jgi:hypothetical protein
MKRTVRHAVSLLAVVAVVFALAAAAEACPTCKDAIAASDPAHQNMARGYFYSILFMMAMPFVLIGSFGGYMWLEVRRARQKEQGGGNDGMTNSE